MPPLSSPLSSEDRRALLALARQAISEVVRQQQIVDFPPPAGRLAECSGAFVTVHCRRRLRGCVGRTDRSQALAEVVAQCAIGAALRDPRFRPLEPTELGDMEIEISVLSELQQVLPHAVEAGVHGVLVSRDGRRGLLLPQVAAERGWPVERFLEETCRKAGLDPSAWKDPETKLFAFTAAAFSEADFCRHESRVAIGPRE